MDICGLTHVGITLTSYRHLAAEAGRERASEDDISSAQLAAMTPLARRLFGLDAWL